MSNMTPREMAKQVSSRLRIGTDVDPALRHRRNPMKSAVLVTMPNFGLLGSPPSRGGLVEGSAANSILVFWRME